MNKAQLIDLLAQRMDGDKRAASVAVEGVVDIVVRTVQAGENVTITGFGVFERRSRAARVARNPRTGQTVHVAPTSVPSFRPGTTFKAVVSGEVELTADAPAVKRSASARATGTATRTPAAKAPAKKAPATKAPAAKKATATTTAAKKAPATKAPAKAPAKAATTRAASTSAPKTAAAKTAAKAAAASAPPKAPKVEKPAKGKKVDGKKKPKSKK